jgi:hypothetical protein
VKPVDTKSPVDPVAPAPTQVDPAVLDKTIDTTQSKTSEENAEKEPSEEPSRTRKAIVFFGDAFFAGLFSFLAVKGVRDVTDFPPVCEAIFNMAKDSAFLQEHLGTPIDRSLLWWGTVADNYAKVSIDVSGPLGVARVDAKAIQGYNGDWEVVYLHGALPKFEMRLTDLLPPEEGQNTMPYIPQHNDPSAAHALRGAPGLNPAPAKQ